MGGKMSCLTNSEPKSEEASVSNGGSSSPSSLVKSKNPKRSSSSVPDDHSYQTRRHKKMQHLKKKNLQIHQKELMMMSSRDNSLILEDSSAGFRTPRRKIRPSSSRQVPRPRLIRDTKDSMCLDRPMKISNNYWRQEEEGDEEEEGEEEEGKSECLSVISGKEVKRVRFKLPHVVILYSPEVEETQGYYCNATRDNSSSSSSSSSFYLTLDENFRGAAGSDGFSFSLAVETLPQASFSSGL